MEHLPLCSAQVFMVATTVVKSERLVRFPGVPAPAWLIQEYPGDHGSDPAGLAKGPADFAKYWDAEGGIDYLGHLNLIHALNAALILFTTLLFTGPVEAWRWNGAMASEAKTLEQTI